METPDVNPLLIELCKRAKAYVAAHGASTLVHYDPVPGGIGPKQRRSFMPVAQVDGDYDILRLRDELTIREVNFPYECVYMGDGSGNADKWHVGSTMRLLERLRKLQVLDDLADV